MSGVTARRRLAPILCCLSCGIRGVAGLCTECQAEWVMDRLADMLAEEGEAIREREGPGVAPLPVREHLRPQGGLLRSSRAELDVALVWERKPERDPDGWRWDGTCTMPAPHAEAIATAGSA
jgi:hypothetical protein